MSGKLNAPAVEKPAAAVPAKAVKRSRRKTGSILLRLFLVTVLVYLRFRPTELSWSPSAIWDHLWNHGLHVSNSFEKSASTSYVICVEEGSAIYTSELDVKQVDCVRVENGTITRLGSYDETHGLPASQALTTYRLPKGSIMTPVSPFNSTLTLDVLTNGISQGFTDSHAHTLQYGHAQELNLLGSRSIQEVIDRLETYVHDNPQIVAEGAWIEGQGWDQTLWETKEFPTAADFEASSVLRDLPISLSRIDIHAEWVSPAILKLLGDLPSTVEGGKIIRYPDGTPTGIFMDDAMELIDKVRPQWTETLMRKFLKRTTKDAVSKGVTGIHDAYGAPEHVEFYQKMAKEDKLDMRFYIMRKCPEKDKYCGDEYPMVDGGDMLQVRSVKLFADGALGSWGAAMLEPYSDRPDQTGIMRTPEGAWTKLIDDFVRNGWQTNAHCIGDRANHVVLNAMEAAIEKYGPADRRLRIEHSQIMTPDDLARAARLGVIASYQPTHATSDMWYAEDRIGKDRLKGAYAWQSYLRLGGRIALGSDFPVESIDPLKGFFAAIARTSERGDSPHGPEGWYPEEKLTREQALRGFTIDAAYASFQEDNIGSFKVGKKFDAVVWSKDIMRVEPATEVLSAKTLVTIVGGKEVYGSLAKI